jgi:Leucine-rich repeat (LRR) protein
LDLSNNRISKIEGIDNLPEVKFIDLTNNKITNKKTVKKYLNKNIMIELE